ncbi:MAG: hypothetical protein DWQ08_04035 [Proteobacteria bacterium]|nr:MAG: hypothetical protein DWQ08_04035 [Pseudomonadota bacterium]
MNETLNNDPLPESEEDAPVDSWAYTSRAPYGGNRAFAFAEKFWRVPLAIRRERIASCKACEAYNAATAQCRHCHCIMPVKAWFGGFSCPLGRWSALSAPGQRKNEGE